MFPQKFGNWTVKETGIEWEGTPSHYPLIERSRINEVRSGTNLYDWLLHIPTKTWLNQRDIILFNSAFVYALSAYGIGFSDEINLSETLRRQNNI